jgi:FkbM family methyltransferase
MKLPGRVQYFAELTRVAGVKSAAVLMFAHAAQKMAPALSAGLRNTVLTLNVDGCSQPVSLRLATSDKDAFRQIFVYEEYSPLRGLENIRTIVDCGANIGLASLYLLDRYPLARLLAIEPDPGNAAMCRQNLFSSGGRVCVETMGIWSHGDWGRPARLRLDRSAGDRRDWSITVREAGVAEEADATGVSMSAICQRTGEIDLLKIDVEGAEELIFSGSSVSWLARVRNIAIELHNEKCRQAFRRALEGFEFESFQSRETVFIKNLRPAGKTVFRSPDCAAASQTPGWNSPVEQVLI